MLKVLEIAVSMCLLSDPTNCRTTYAYTDLSGDDESVIVCTDTAPLVAEHVMGSYPEYNLKQWACATVDQGQQRWSDQ